MGETGDTHGRFQTTIPYLCGGDKPDLYFWVEYDLGNGFETVYEPPIACWTYWDYACGTDVTIHVSDQRVPGCSDDPDLPGKQVWVLSIGRSVSIGEIHTSAPQEGMVSEPWGAYAGDPLRLGAHPRRLRPVERPRRQRRRRVHAHHAVPTMRRRR